MNDNPFEDDTDNEAVRAASFVRNETSAHATWTVLS